METGGADGAGASPRKDLPRRLSAYMRDEFEIWIILLFMAAWWSSTLDGGLWVDETVYASSAKAIAAGDFYTNLEHPPLGKYMISIGITALGDTSFGARFVPMLFGLMTVFLTYRVGRMLGNRGTATLAAALLGITPAFNALAGQAMLDMFLTFFVMALIYVSLLVIRKRGSLGDASRRELLFLGVLSACAVMSKLYGVFFVGIVYLFLLNSELSRASEEGATGWSWRDIRIAPRDPSAKYFVIVLLAASALIYLPYLLKPHETLPYLVGLNAVHLGTGHTASIAGEVYDYPPVWTYLYWIYSEGFIFITGTVCALAWLVLRTRSGGLPEEDRFLMAYTFVPLLAFSLMTVKFERFLLPLWPLIIILSTVYLYRLLVPAFRSLHGGPERGPDARTSSLLTMTTIALLLVASPSPVIEGLSHTHISPDSGYDDAAELILDIHASNSSRDLRVLSSHSDNLEYYLGDAKGVTVHKIHWDSEDLLEELMVGEYDLVVDKAEQPRFETTDIYKFIRTESRDRIDMDGEAVVFILGDIDYEH